MRWLGWPYLLVLALLAVAQLLLGASAWVLIVLLAIAAAALMPLAKARWRVSDGLYAIMTVYFGSASLVVKTVAAQPVHTNLHVPDLAAGYLLAGFLSISIGYGLSQMIRRPSRLAERLRTITADPATLSHLAVPIFALGALFLLLQTQFRAVASNGGFEGGGFGGFGAFYPLLPLGAGMQAALVARSPGGWRYRSVLACMGAVILALTLADNTKRTLFDFLFVVAATFLASGARWRWRWMVPAAVGAALLLGLLVPAIQIVRSQSDVRGLDRIAASWQVMHAYDFDPNRLSMEADRIATGFQLAWRDSYVFPQTWNVERFTMIQPIDQVARALPAAGVMGGDDLWRDPAETLLPGFLIDKSLATAPDRIAWHYGFRANGSIARPVVGLVASSLAAFGLAGVLLLPALTVAFTFAVLDYVAGRLRGNVWAVFVLATTAFLAEREVSTTLAFFCRGFLVILLIGAAVRLVGTRPVRRVRIIPVNEMLL